MWQIGPGLSMRQISLCALQKLDALGIENKRLLKSFCPWSRHLGSENITKPKVRVIRQRDCERKRRWSSVRCHPFEVLFILFKNR